jgi:hypothetical protein
VLLTKKFGIPVETTRDVGCVVKIKRLIPISLANSPRISFIVKGITENLRTTDNLIYHMRACTCARRREVISG